MMRPTSLVVVTTGKSTAVPLDRYVNGYAFGVSMKTAGANYTLKYSLSDPEYDAVASFNAGQPVKYSVSYNVSGVWNDWDDPLLVKASTNRTTNAAFAPRGVRVSAISKVSAGNPLVLDIVPMGMDGG